ncbi:hypothetical protein GCM10027514_23390 [Azotobacter armeniacus]
MLATLALEGCVVTIDAGGTQPGIAQAIRKQKADYVLAVKGNQPTLLESIEDFFETFRRHAPERTPARVLRNGRKRPWAAGNPALSCFRRAGLPGSPRALA